MQQLKGQSHIKPQKRRQIRDIPAKRKTGTFEWQTLVKKPTGELKEIRYQQSNYGIISCL